MAYPNVLSKEILAQFAEIDQKFSQADDSFDSKFQETASVLIYFDPDTLRANNELIKTGWANFLLYCEPATEYTQGNWWQLSSSVRRQALKRLGSRPAMIKALEVNPERQKSTAQSLFEDILYQRSIVIDQLPREALVTLSGIIDWLKGIISLDKESEAVQQALPIEDLLAPLRRLATIDFVGRQEELSTLTTYMTTPVAPIPLLIYGPGGVGKSTLLAKFILDTISPNSINRVPFAYLDIDRPIINPEQPATFILEAARQLSTQLPAHKSQLLHLGNRSIQFLNFQDGYESSKSIDSTDSFAYQFGSILSAIPQNILFIIDTFEEAQFMGDEVVNEIWSLLLLLQQNAPNLRVVVAGRANVEYFPVQPIPLKELSEPEAQLLLQRSLGTPTDAVQQKNFDEILSLVGLNPLSLRLAADIVKKQGIDKLNNAETRRWLALKMRAEIVQAKLYGRILNHIHDDKNVKKLAYPGLIIRRITPEIIQSVLAKPCKLKLTAEQTAESIFEKLAKEVALVDRDPVDGSLRHRQDVRRIMLKDLVDAIPDKLVRAIHDRAVTFYSKKTGDIPRAEELYHRLSRGDSAAVLETRWQPGSAQYLRNALEELPAKERLWLSRQLGVTPHPDLVQQADLQTWEDITALTVNRHLLAGKPEKALAKLRERPDRSPASPLYRLELEALRMLGRLTEAGALVDSTLSSIKNHSNKTVIRELLIQASLINEAESHLDKALTYANEAETMLDSESDPIDILHTLVANIRLLRKSGENYNSKRSDLIEHSKKILADEAVLNSLRKYPVLLRELTAELGKSMPQLLQHSMDVLGVEIRDEEQISTLSQALVDWNASLSKSSNSIPGELVIRAGIKGSSKTTWADYINKNLGSPISGSIQYWRNEIVGNEFTTEAKNIFDNTLVDIIRYTVDASLTKSNVSSYEKSVQADLGSSNPDQSSNYTTF